MKDKVVIGKTYTVSHMWVSSLQALELASYRAGNNNISIAGGGDIER